jgi:hypothetical protein
MGWSSAESPIADTGIFVVAGLLIFTKKISPPLIVLGTVIAGIVWTINAW